VRFPVSILLSLALLAGCSSTPTDPEEPAPGESAEAENPDGAPEAPENLLKKPERLKLYWQLEQYGERYMRAQDKSEIGTRRAVHEELLRPLVDENLEELLRTLAREDESEFRRIAALGLGFGTDAGRIVPALAPVLGEEDVTLVNNAVLGLWVLDDPRTPVRPLVELLNHPDPDIRNNAPMALARTLRARKREGLGPDREIKRASGRLVLLVSTPTEDDHVRAHAAAALGAIGDPAATDILVNLLDDDSSAVRTRSAEGLGMLGREEAITPLIDALNASRAPTERRMIIASLTHIAKIRGYPCDPEALGAKAENWRNWYLAVSR
jgi:hypothetical protein